MNRSSAFIGFLALVSVVLLTAGCVTSYQEATWYHLTGGYTDEAIYEDEFLVKFAGNGFTPEQTDRDYASLRAAELTLEHGFRYFAIMDDYTQSGGDNCYIITLRILCFHERPTLKNKKVFEARELSERLKRENKLP